MHELAQRVERAIRPRPTCRECADRDGRCDDGELCDPTEKAAEIANEVDKALSRSPAGYAPLSAQIDMGVINRIRTALDAADDNAGELLQIHDQQLGRTTKKNLNIAMMYEQEIEEIRCLIGMLPKDPGA